MTTVQHALAVGLQTPYTRMLRFLDGVPEVAPMPAALPTNIALNCCSSSPDGRYWVAAGSASQVNPLRMWKLEANLDITAVLLDAALPVAGTIVDIKFVTNNHIVAVDSLGGPLFGVFNRTTGVITWTRLSALSLWVGVENISDDRFIINRGPGSAPYSLLYLIQGDTAVLETWTGLTANPYADRSAVHRPSKMIFGPRSNTGNANSSTQIIWFDIPSKTMSMTAAYIDYTSTDISRLVGGASAAFATCAKFSPSGRHVAVGLNVAPWLRMAVQISGRKYPNTVHSFRVATEGATMDDQPIAAMVNDVEFVGNDILLVAVNSRFGGTGRVKGYFHSDGDEKLVEDNRIKTIFNDWDSVGTGLTSGPLETLATAASSLYDSAVQTLVGRTGDLNNMKLALLSEMATFDPSHTTLAQVLGANEVYGSSWPQGGIDANDGSWSQASSSEYAFDLTFPYKDLNLAGSITFRRAVLYDNTDANKKPLIFFDLGENKTFSQLDRLQFNMPGSHAVLFAAA